MKQDEVLQILTDTGAFRTGHFQYSSGLHGQDYIQCALLLKEPILAERLCAALADKFRHLQPDVVVGPAIGGILVSYEVARALGVSSLFTERENGEVKLRRMFSIQPGQRVLITEDVITTGLSSREAVAAIRALGGDVVGVGALVDRSGGQANMGVPHDALVKLDLLKWKPEDCPLCKQGLPLYKPGSRVKVLG